MTPADHSLQDLRARLDALEARVRLNDAADEALELALRDRLPLESALRSLLPLLCTHTGARYGWVRTYDEELKLREFRFGGDRMPLDMSRVSDRTDRGDHFALKVEEMLVVAQPLDVAGENFGSAAIVYEQVPSPAKIALSADLLNTWCEELDNYLASIARAREKVRITRELSAALRAPVLEEGLTAALEAFGRAVPFDDLLLVLRHADDPRGASLHYKIVQNGELTHDSQATDMEVDEFVREHAGSMIGGESRALLERFGVHRGREEVLITGVRNAQVLGRLVVTSQSDSFNTFDRDLLERFADYLRQRVMDFNRQWRRLTHTFPGPVVRRLLLEEDYTERYLRPRERDVAVLFADISGFTRVCEQVLREPAKIGTLVDTWGAQVVDAIWEAGGVFDKMVGDCVIGLFGPPFDDFSPQAACEAALSTAKRIREITHQLGNGGLLPELAGLEPPIGVATGLNYCPLYVGTFGPDEDYTGFSSGMNSTARLQGVASCDEILASTHFVDVLADRSEFGEEQQAKVKNVAEPLRYRALLG